MYVRTYVFLHMYVVLRTYVPVRFLTMLFQLDHMLMKTKTFVPSINN